MCTAGTRRSEVKGLSSAFSLAQLSELVALTLAQLPGLCISFLAILVRADPVAEGLVVDVEI
jgi:hypothetical protein